MTADDIARKVASRNGLDAGHDRQRRAGLRLRPAEQRDRLGVPVAARGPDRLRGDRRRPARSTSATPGRGAAGDPIELRFGDNLQTFRPRVTGVQQVDSVVVRGWDPSAGEAIEATADAPAPADLDSSIGIARSDVVSALGGGTVTVADRPVLQRRRGRRAGEAACAARLANAYVEAEGSCVGNPKIRAGGRIDVKGIGTRFGGTYTLSSSDARPARPAGYQTQLLDLRPLAAQPRRPDDAGRAARAGATRSSSAR